MTSSARLAVASLSALLVVLAGCAGARPSGGDAPSTGSGTTAASGSSASTGSTSPGSTSPSPALATPVDPVEARVDEALAGLDRRAQVGQLFVVGVHLPDLSAADGLVRTGVGGIFLAGRSMLPASDTAGITGAWRAEAPGPPPWICVDQEGGLVQTLKGPGFERLPSALDQGELHDARLRQLADGLGASLATAGVDLNLAPVADVVPAGTGDANPPIGGYDRQYGSTADEVVEAAGTIVDGLHAHGVTATLKHFPGLGRVDANTDFSTGVTDTVTTADGPQVAAFGRLAATGALPMVMVSTATYTQIDPSAVAAFSPVVIGDVLRDRLGFDGAVISDDLGSAKSVAAVPVGERAVRFVAAGGTLVLTNTPGQFAPMVDAVLARAASDPTFAATVDAAVRTALRAKVRAGLV